MLKVLKRIIDIVVSAIGLIILVPLFLMIIIVIRFSMGTPVLFKQMRPGLNSKTFLIYKFRTMTDCKDENESLLPDDKRITRLGVFLRKTSLDELPELFNVLKGDMSLVGPRPLLVQYLQRYTPLQARRHQVRPGITGWAQINGRNAISWEEKFALDIWYVDNWSLWLDFRILVRTITMVIKRQGINVEGSATVPEFMGNSLHQVDGLVIGEAAVSQETDTKDR